MNDYEKQITDAFKYQRKADIDELYQKLWTLEHKVYCVEKHKDIERDVFNLKLAIWNLLDDGDGA